MIENLVSVVVPVYNGLKDLPRALRSLELQTYKSWECIIVNDGSTDGTKEYLDSLKDTRFRIFHFDTNKGRPFARQKALEEAKGEFLAVLDADDFYAPEKLAIQVNLLNKNKSLSLVSSLMCLFGDEQSIIRISKSSFKTNTIRKYDNKKKYLPAHGPSIFRLDKAIKYKYNTKLLYGEDSDFMQRYLEDNPFFMVLPDILYYYSAFDSITIKDIRSAHQIKFNNSFIFREKLIALVMYFYSLLILPIVGIRFEIKRRGNSPTDVQVKKYNRIKKDVFS